MTTAAATTTPNASPTIALSTTKEDESGGNNRNTVDTVATTEDSSSSSSTIVMEEEIMAPPPQSRVISAPTYPAGRSTVARYDSFGMDDDDDDEEESDYLEEEEESDFDCSMESCSAPPSFRPFQSSNINTTTRSINININTTNVPAVVFASLPQDAIHTIATFSSPRSFSSLSQTCRSSHLACRDVFTKIKMHAYRCAKEVCTAWTRGEHADARELCALYVREGVPVYPIWGGGGGRGHGYHSLRWRMGLEIQGMEGGNDDGGNNNDGNNNDGNNDNDGNNNDGAANNKPTLDPFYPQRFQQNNNQDQRDQFHSRNHTLTYVEEKTLFWKRKKGIAIDPPPQSQHPHLQLHQHPQFGGISQHHGALMGGMGGRRHSLNNMSAEAFRHVMREQNYNHRHGNGNGEGNGNGGHGNDSFATLPRSNSMGRGMNHASININNNNNSTNNYSNTTTPQNNGPKMTLRIHKHLVDQHLFGLPSIHDDNGNMMAGPMSLNSDFFHPHWSSSIKHYATNTRNNREYLREEFRGGGGATGRNNNEFSSGMEGLGRRPRDFMELQEQMEQFLGDGAGGRMSHSSNADDDDWGNLGMDNADTTTENDGAVDIGESIDSRMRGLGLMEDVSREVPAAASASATATPTSARSHFSRFNRRHSIQPSSSVGAFDSPSFMNASPASDVHLEIYNSSSPGFKADRTTTTSTMNTAEEDFKTCEALDKLRARYERYQRKLDSFLANFDHVGFDECLLDFWDEMFPSSAGIHFFNRQSPVPRMSKLHTFLTTPCPKALGTVQCEIVRVKTSSKKKGVNVKGRFFPTYEYRLFIRDVKNDNPHNIPHFPARKDSVLLVAKNKSRKNKNVTGAESNNATSSKRGVNNYYMCLPQQRDVDMHYKSANHNINNATLAPGEKSGLDISPLAARSNAPVEVGRLQSNFIGTEFQIFSPTMTKQRRTRDSSYPVSDPASPSSDEELEDLQEVRIMDNNTLPSTNSSRQNNEKGRSGLARLARRASLKMTRRGSMNRNQEGEDSSEEGQEQPRPSTSTSTGARSSRRMSWGPSFPNSAKKSARTNRRAIANSMESDGCSNLHAVMGEEENGAITYTANLLGNRPRIMDVCIPKVLEDGRVSTEWRRGLDSTSEGGDASGSSNNKLLNRFKAIQQRLENPEATTGPNGETISVNADDHGIQILQNRPPWWNMELGAFVLNFGGRVSVASVKNFQLCERNNVDASTLVQFGRIQGRHAFTMDFQHPLTPVQAFAIAISSLQSKISFG